MSRTDSEIPLGESPSPDVVPRSTYPTPLNEEARLQSLYSLNILDTPPEERFDRIVNLAQAVFGTQMVRLTFVDRDRTWYKACVGPEANEGSRDTALCAHTVMNDEILVSLDLSQDPRFRNHPQVLAGPKLRFYAGAPIILADGMRVGTLCIFDTAPRDAFSDKERGFLADFAQIVVHELKLHGQIADREDRLVDAGRKLAVARAAKERFMGIVGHELKTPLSHIVGFGSILAHQHLGPLGNDHYLELAQSISRSATHLEGLVDRVLNFTSAEAGELWLCEATVATDKVLEMCLALTRIRSKAKGVAVQLSVADDAPAYIFVDEVQFAEAVVQVLDNAIAFSPDGEDVALYVCRASDGALCLRILDRGPGIEQERLERAMFAFTQDNEECNREHEGIGLGLAVAHAILELHGGTVKIGNRSDGGTIVEMVLPATRNQPKPVEATFAGPVPETKSLGVIGDREAEQPASAPRLD